MEPTPTPPPPSSPRGLLVLLGILLVVGLVVGLLAGDAWWTLFHGR